METQIWTIYTCFWLTLLGAVAGSFLECAVSRWAAGQPPFSGRSRCSACGRTLEPGELVPVVSFLLQRGQCRHCGEDIPSTCLWAELSGAFFFLCLGLVFGPQWVLGQWVVFAILLFGGLYGFVGMLIGVPLLAVIFGVLRSIVNGLLRRKGMSTDARDYASDQHPIP